MKNKGCLSRVLVVAICVGVGLSSANTKGSIHLDGLDLEPKVIRQISYYDDSESNAVPNDNPYEDTTAIYSGTSLGEATITADDETNTIKLESLKDLCSPRSNAKEVSSFIDYENEVADNLRYRADPNDPSGKSDYIVEKDGSVWRMGLIAYREEGIVFGGYANNDNFNSNNWPEYFAGSLYGEMYGGVFTPENPQPDDALFVHDQNGDGPGYLVHRENPRALHVVRVVWLCLYSAVEIAVAKP